VHRTGASAAKSVTAEASTAAQTTYHRCLTVAFIDTSTGKDIGSMDTGGPPLDGRHGFA